MKRFIIVFLITNILINSCSVFGYTQSDEPNGSLIVYPVADGCYDTYTNNVWRGETANMYTTHGNGIEHNNRMCFMMFDMAGIRERIENGFEITSARVKLTVSYMNSNLNNYNAQTNPDAQGPKVALYAFEDDSWDEYGTSMPVPLTRQQAEANIVSKEIDNPACNYTIVPNQATDYSFELDISDHLKSELSDENDKYMSLEVGYRSQWIKSGTYLLYTREYKNNPDFRPQLIVEYRKKEVKIGNMNISEGELKAGNNAVSFEAVNNLGTDKNVTAVIALYKTDSQGIKSLEDVALKEIQLSEAEHISISETFDLSPLQSNEKYEGRVFVVDGAGGIKPLSKAYNTAYKYECYLNEDFDDITVDSIKMSEGDVSISPSLEKWRKCLRLDSKDGETALSGFYPGCDMPNNFSVSFDMMFAGSQGTRSFGLCNTTGEMIPVFSTDKSCVTFGGKEVCTYQRAKYYNMRFDFDVKSEICTFYLDDEKVGETRIEISAQESADGLYFRQESESSASKVFVDNLTVYSGNLPAKTEMQINRNVEIGVKRILDDSIAYVEGSNSYLKYGERIYHSYETENDFPGDAANKYYENSHGVILAGKHDYPDMLEESENVSRELIRSVCYHRPSADTILYDYVNGGMENTHPSILVGDGGFEKIKENINSNAEVETIYEKVKETADSYLDMEPIEYSRTDGRRLDEAQNMYSRYLPPLCMMYNLTGDEKYAEAAWKHVDVLCSDAYPEWGNLSVEHLNVSELSSAVIICYDWLYDWLSEERREQIRRAVIEKSIKIGLEFYNSDIYWLDGVWNWNMAMASGLSVAAIGMLCEEPFLCSSLVSKYLESIENSLSSFHPKGYWEEGLGYWGYSVLHLTALTSSLENVFKTDYGIFSTSGLNETSYFPIYCTGPSGIFNFHDTGEESQAPAMAYFARVYNRPELMAYIGKRVQKIHPNYRVLLWYDPDMAQSGYESLSRDALYSDAGMAFMRSDWSDNALYTGLHAGNSKVGHSHLDSGNFIIDANGERWITDPGRDFLSYYIGVDQRFQVWAVRTEAHNCIVINPGTDGGQIEDSYSPIIESGFSDESAYAIADLTPAYDAEIESYRRGLLLGDNRKCVIVRDEIKSDVQNDIRWSVTVKVDNIVLSDDGKSLVLEKKGKKLFMKIADGSGVFEIRDANPLQTSPNPDGQVSRKGLKQIEIWNKGVKDMSLSVAFVPVDDELQIPQYSFVSYALDEWKNII